MKTVNVLGKTLGALFIVLWWSAAFGQGGSSASPHGALDLKCSDCHTTAAWRPIRTNPDFDHQTTHFPLAGRHVQVQCVSCHTNLDFSKAGIQCKDCHLDVHRGQFSYTCTVCHTASQWTNQREMFQRHQQTRFPLTGVHTNVDCQACHATGQYAGISTDCGSCHLQVYEQATTPVNHAAEGFPTDCSQCHSVMTAGWTNPNFHNETFAGISHPCFSCHQSNYQNAADPNHAAGNFGHNCAVCHEKSGWRPASFDHNLSGFQLNGAHATAQCAQCHTLNGQPRYTGTPMQCYSCHEANFQNSTNPPHAAGNFPHECGQCHNATAWQPATFDHNLSTFPLTGAHVNAQCTQCHTNGQFANTPTDCYTCHTANFQGTTNPPHVARNLSHDCRQCHTTAAWQPATFDHSLSSFALTGAHVTAQCGDCHANGRFTGTPAECFACHRDGFEGANNPPHVQGDFSRICSRCHSTALWSPSTFNHASTNYPLTGAHAPLSCLSCHRGGPYRQTPTDCYSCHTASFNGANNPTHASQNFPHDCTVCHNNVAWQPWTFQHAPGSLAGAHASLQCGQCHTNGQFTNTPTDCWSCHQANYNGANNPNHASQNFPHDCTICHNNIAWQPSTFNHQTSSFPLTGRHTSVSCTQCHVNGQYAGTPTDCYSCHRVDYEGTRDPDHVARNYSHDCTQCHTTNGWGDGGGFNHSTTPFPLTGAHTTAQCNQCHVNGHYTGTPTECFACHRDNFEGAFNPPHEQGNFSRTCSRCHSTRAWQPSSFTHNSTRFPLIGAHVALSCQSCHRGGPYSRTPTECYSCHQANYDGATNPNHATNQFDHNCLRCHNETAWSPSTFNHANTTFPLNGAHVNTACNLCHINGQYQGTPTDCWSCHQTNYNNVTDPNHVTNQFDHNCLTCHTTSAWNPATFDHNNTTFPLTGAHVNTACNLCHVNGQYQGTPTDCWSCHQTNYNNVTDPNHVTNQFDHNCLTCHTTSAWNPATFDHNNTTFPLTGAHVNTACNLCHINGQYQGTPTDCYFCHQNDYNGATNPNHQAAGFPTTCQTCHNTTAWTPATFNHDGPYFPIYSGHHQGTWTTCADCHPNPNDFTVFTCISCHEHSQSRMDNEHSDVSGYVYDSQHCLQCHPRGGGGGLNMTPPPRKNAR